MRSTGSGPTVVSVTFEPAAELEASAAAGAGAAGATVMVTCGAGCGTTGACAQAASASSAQSRSPEPIRRRVIVVNVRTLDEATGDHSVPAVRGSGTPKVSACAREFTR